MRGRVTLLLLLLCAPCALAQNAAEVWRVVKDAKGACRISAPKEWVEFSESGGAVMLQDASTAIAVVTSQPGQAFKPLPEPLLRSLAIPKEKMFENTAKRVFYQDRTAARKGEQSAFSVSVPAGTGTCSCHVAFTSAVPEETARKIALSLAPAEE